MNDHKHVVFLDVRSAEPQEPTDATCPRCGHPRISERERYDRSRAMGRVLTRCCCLRGGAAYMVGGLDHFSDTKHVTRHS